MKDVEVVNVGSMAKTELIQLRLFSLIQLLTAMITFGIYFYFIEPVITENVWFKILIFALVFLTLSYFSKRFEGHFKFLDKRIDNQLSVWIVIGLIFIPLFIIF